MGLAAGVAGLSVFSNLMGAEADYRQSAAQWEADEVARAQTNKNALDALVSSWGQLDEQARQVQENAAAAEIDLQKSAAIAEGEAAAAAGAGKGGNADMIQRSITQQAATQSSRINLMRKRELQQIQAEKEGAENQFKGRINLMPNPAPEKNVLGNLFSAGVSGFRSFAAAGGEFNFGSTNNVTTQGLGKGEMGGAKDFVGATV